MKRIVVCTVSLLVLALAPFAGCRKEEPKSIGDVRSERENTWKKKWNEESEQSRAAETEKTDESEAPAPTSTVGDAQFGTSGHMDDEDLADPDAQSAEERQLRREEEEADKDMPGKYK